MFTETIHWGVSVNYNSHPKAWYNYIYKNLSEG